VGGPSDLHTLPLRARSRAQPHAPRARHQSPRQVGTSCEGSPATFARSRSAPDRTRNLTRLAPGSSPRARSETFWEGAPATFARSRSARSPHTALKQTALNVGAHAPPPRALRVRQQSPRQVGTFWEGAPANAGGGSARGHPTTALKQTAAERRPSRTTTAGHTDGGAPAIRTLREGGPRAANGLNACCDAAVWAPPGVRPMLARRVVNYTPRCASGVRPDLPHTSASRDGIQAVHCSCECWGEGFCEKPSQIKTEYRRRGSRRHRRRRSRRRHRRSRARAGAGRRPRRAVRRRRHRGRSTGTAHRWR
jgi:hypothetical protein